MKTEQENGFTYRQTCANRYQVYYWSNNPDCGNAHWHATGPAHKTEAAAKRYIAGIRKGTADPC